MPAGWPRGRAGDETRSAATWPRAPGAWPRPRWAGSAPPRPMARRTPAASPPPPVGAAPRPLSEGAGTRLGVRSATGSLGRETSLGRTLRGASDGPPSTGLPERSLPLGTSAGSSGCLSRRSPSRSALRRTRSAWASSMLDEWLVTPMPRSRQRSSASLLVRPSSRPSSYTRIFLAKSYVNPFMRPRRRRSLSLSSHVLELSHAALLRLPRELAPEKLARMPGGWPPVRNKPAGVLQVPRRRTTRHPDQDGWEPGRAPPRLPG